MASPRPDTSILDPKPREPVFDAELKSEVNGHSLSPKPSTDVTSELPTKPEPEPEAPAKLETEPLAPTKPEPVDKPEGKPLLNGDGKAEDHAGTNGVSMDIDVKSSDPVEEKSPAHPPLNETPIVEKVEVTVEVKEPAPEPSMDVDMIDAKPTEDITVSPPLAPEESRQPLPASPRLAGEADLPPAKEPTPPTTVNTETTEKPSEVTTSSAQPEKTDEHLPVSEVDLGPSSMSQLAIETTELDAAPTSIDVSMTDAPTIKVAREREYDTSDEPAPKRAKTEPKDDDETKEAGPTDVPASEAIPSDSGAKADAQSLSSLTQWDDAESDAKPISPYQQREIRKVIARIKKTKAGSAFRDSVQKLWPVLWPSYLEKIEKPMDLAEVDRNVKERVYTTFGEFKKNLGLIYLNTLSFNGPAHDVTASAFTAIRSTWEDIHRIPEEEPEKPKAIPKSKPAREPRLAAMATISAATVNTTPAKADTNARKKSSGAAASPAAESVEAKAPVPTSTEQQSASARRASTTADGDRPKRTVRAPKPKDIDYSTKASRKKLKPELQFCEEVLAELMGSKNSQANQWFIDRVDAEGLGIPQYYSIIKKPMHLSKISELLASGEIQSLKDFDKNVRLVFTNCWDFNGPPDQGNPISVLAKQLEGAYNSLMKNKDSWLAKHAKANAPRAASLSNASDEESEDDEDDGDAAGPPGIDPSKDVKEFEDRYHEETRKLNELILGDKPTASKIAAQQAIVNVIRDALVTAKHDLSDFLRKQEKSGKKGGKSGKSKASGGAASRKSTGGAAQSKKSGGSKKATKKKLTAGDKDQIANAINDLEGNHLDRAIDIIKRDTGQNENNDGELELDIDQLSNEALLMLWELCKKVLPGFAKDSAPATKSPEATRPSVPKQPKSSSSSSKPKKNKPMSAEEQEARIAQLRGLRDLYKPGQEPLDDAISSIEAATAMADSSDESDSEEE